jgi:exosortase
VSSGEPDISSPSGEAEMRPGHGSPSAERATPGGLALPPRRFSVGAALGAIALSIAVYAPVLYYMVLHWWQVEDYSHGFLIVPLAAYFAWERRDELARAPIQPSWWGVVPLLVGVACLSVGRLGVELMTMRWGFIFTLMGIVLLLLGRPVFRVLGFPLFFLFLMVPLPQSLTNTITFPLQLIATDLAVDALYLLEVPALREGNIIHLARSQLFVAEACSGLRSVMALVTLGVVVGYMFQKSTGEWILIALSAIPIAILVNAFRVALTGVLTHELGEGAAEGVIHATEGLFTFGIAFVLLLLEAWLLSIIWPRRWRKQEV